MDTGTPSGRLLFHVLGAIAEFERDLIAERTRAGLAAARRRDRHPGKPRAHERKRSYDADAVEQKRLTSRIHLPAGPSTGSR